MREIWAPPDLDVRSPRNQHTPQLGLGWEDREQDAAGSGSDANRQGICLALGGDRHKETQLVGLVLGGDL